MNYSIDWDGPGETDDDAARYVVEVWNFTTGDLVEKLWDASADEADEILEQYADEEPPVYQVVVEPK